MLVLALTALAPRSAGAGPLGMAGSDIVSPDGVAYTLYTGKIPSFDGVPLDVDLTVPQGPVTPRPLVVMLHGWGGSKTDWESATRSNSSPDEDGYNNVAFVARLRRPQLHRAGLPRLVRARDAAHALLRARLDASRRPTVRDPRHQVPQVPPGSSAPIGRRRSTALPGAAPTSPPAGCPLAQ